MARPAIPAALGAALALVALHPAAAGAQAPRFSAPRWHAELGVSTGVGPYVEDENGAEVTAGAGPALAVFASWIGARPTVTLDVGLRAARLPVTASVPGAELEADPALHLDLVGSAGWRALPRLTLRAGLALTRLTGDDDVTPFRDGNGSPWHAGGEIGALWHAAPRWAVATTLHGTRLGAATVGDPVQKAGVMTRISLGVRYGR